jgi:hypothetical protein
VIKNKLDLKTLFICLLLSSLCFGQNSVPKAAMNDADSTLAQIEQLTAEYAKIMATWSPEKKKRFAEVFVMTRGQITIPKEPIVWDSEME